MHLRSQKKKKKLSFGQIELKMHHLPITTIQCTIPMYYCATHNAIWHMQSVSCIAGITQSFSLILLLPITIQRTMPIISYVLQLCPAYATHNATLRHVLVVLHNHSHHSSHFVTRIIVMQCHLSIYVVYCRSSIDTATSAILHL